MVGDVPAEGDVERSGRHVVVATGTASGKSLAYQLPALTRLADEAIGVSEGTDYLDRRGDCHEVRGLVLDAAGRGADARASYGEALALYTRKGNVVAAARVRKRIEGVSGSVAPT